jgi:hypothetical protein
MAQGDFLKRPEQTQRLERELRLWRAAAALGLISVVLGSCATGKRTPAPAIDSTMVLRVRGIIIEDEQGRPRILLGAPTPTVKERKRADASTGMVVLGPDGSDRLQLGNVGGPQMGGMVQQRMSPATGLMVNDDKGDERAGFGVFENGQAGWGLDFPGGEGVVAAVIPESGFAGIQISGDTEQGRERAMLATSREGGTSLELKDGKARTRSALSVTGPGAATMVVQDENGAVIADLLGGKKK